MISILDYGVGNTGSIINMLKKIGVSAKTIKTKEELQSAVKIILPGVGNFGAAMQRLDPLRELLCDKARSEQIPLLGICLGMQLLCDGSEESPQAKGLGLIGGSCRKIQVGDDLRVPHMGWNYVRATRDSALLSGLKERDRFYFVHSYHVVTKKSEDTILSCDYGEPLAAAIQNDLIFGTQFHPEKSHSFGMKILANFAAL